MRFLQSEPGRHMNSAYLLFICVDINFHVENAYKPDVLKRVSLLDSHDLYQHVQTPTHIAGCTLDLIITRNQEVRTANIRMKHYIIGTVNISLLVSCILYPMELSGNEKN